MSEHIEWGLDTVLRKRETNAKRVSEATGVTQSVISHLRTGKAKGVEFETIVKICRHLRCNVNDIISIRLDEDDKKDA